MNESQLALLRLHMTPQLGRASLFKLRNNIGSFPDILEASPHDWERSGVSARLASQVPSSDSRQFRNTINKLRSLGVQLISFWDQNYPAALKTIHDPPAILYVRGELPTQQCFAIVGSRRASPPGLETTRRIAGELAQHGVCIASGLARGIDSAAHRGALERGGHTIAVLGCGIDRVYPPENSRLFHDIIQNNAIISEYPPETPPLPGHFPGRNRIISGLSQGVLIVEAASGSGSLITGDFALEQGRELFAIPGGPHLPGSQGTNRLLKDGAKLVTDADDIIQELWPNRSSPAERALQEDFSNQLPEEAKRVYQAIGFDPTHCDDIARTCGLTPMELSVILLDLELKGGIRSLPGNHFVRSGS